MLEFFLFVIGIVLLFDMVALRKQNNEIITLLEKIEKNLRP
ncbi:hypothetical protein GGQ92_001552 [Gracilibacillus halotolerans]|uniref:Uncharacterized protein n=1 Tax=Gracilibacillus halotolerans TaxID=74386 RepID=A0A841RMV1_9BACI|nr:hypothetical protein [Gracilibacillus halotolerans]MBB6512766.1 hypothetical protein [Gracilibacillus halotolerans]